MFRRTIYDSNCNIGNTLRLQLKDLFYKGNPFLFYQFYRRKTGCLLTRSFGRVDKITNQLIFNTWKSYSQKYSISNENMMKIQELDLDNRIFPKCFWLVIEFCANKITWLLETWEHIICTLFNKLINHLFQ